MTLQTRRAWVRTHPVLFAVAFIGAMVVLADGVTFAWLGWSRAFGVMFLSVLFSGALFVWPLAWLAPRVFVD